MRLSGLVYKEVTGSTVQRSSDYVFCVAVTSKSWFYQFYRCVCCSVLGRYCKALKRFGI